MHSRLQKSIAEFAGTFAVVFFSAGAICADHFLRTSGQPSISLLGIAAAYGLTVGALTVALGPVSGAHFNPAITITSWVTRRQSTFDALTYCLSQLAGAVAAGYFVRRLPFDVWSAVQAGTPDLAGGITRTDGIILEGVLTFFVVLVLFAAARTFHEARMPYSGGLAVGLVVTAAVLVGGPFTGAALNPARAFGPALAANHWSNHGVYWVGPLAGGVLAGWLHAALFSAKE